MSTVGHSSGLVVGEASGSLPRVGNCCGQFGVKPRDKVVVRDGGQSEYCQERL